MRKSQGASIIGAGLMTVLLVFLPSFARAVQMQLPGSTANQIATLPGGTYSALQVDASRNLYAAADAGGILKVDPSLTITTWSPGQVADLVIAPGGGGYRSGGGICHCIDQLDVNGGATTLHQDDKEWTSLALLPDGTLYAHAFITPGLYRIDRTTGQPTLVFAGGPAADGSGLFFGMTGAPDGKLYVIGQVDNSASGTRLYRLDGANLTQVAILPDGGYYLAPGPSGRLLVSVSGTYGIGYTVGRLWLVDPVSGQSNIVAYTSTYFHQLDNVFGQPAYDSSTGTVYIMESERLWALHLDLSSPARRESWGALKARYR
jgi:hypothetical protein